jgi:murein DD-endopeptidase MepM/ murein hydrolase activator NlpD
VRTPHRTLARLAVILSLAAAPARAQHPRLAIAPEQPSPGALVRVVLRDARAANDSIVSVTGAMAGEPLHFRAAGADYRAIGAVPVDSATSVGLHATVRYASGRADTVRLSVGIPPLPPPTEQLAVASRFGRKLDAATEARVARENARALAVGRRAHQTPRLWTGAFLVPRTSEISSTFGTGRTFNGAVASRHLGVDFRGAVGAPIIAANAGVVALVDRFFLGGRVVYIDHGAGIVTGYVHMSKVLVAVGDTVARGQQIGLVGATGRVTGPHLHWNARYGALTVNPMDLLTIE